MVSERKRRGLVTQLHTSHRGDYYRRAFEVAPSRHVTTLILSAASRSQDK